MNNKGFTTVEVIVSFALVVIIMASMSTMLVAYRDSINIEQTKSKMVEFKNTFTFMVYQDIVLDKVDSIQPCKVSSRCYRNKVTCEYKWGNYSLDGDYTLVSSINSETSCVKPSDITEEMCQSNEPVSENTNEDAGMCVEFIGEGNKKNTLKIEPDVITVGSEVEEQRRIYLNYNGIRMMLPDSDLNKYIIEKDSNGNSIKTEKTVSQINDFILMRDDINRVYSLTIPLEHKGIDYFDNIKIVVAE